MNSDSFKTVKDMFRLDGKKAIVTGSGGGIGSAIAQSLAEFGADVALLDYNLNAIENVKRNLEQKTSARLLAVHIDVCDSEKVNSAVNHVLKEFGRIDILVNCHGIGQWAAAESMAEQDWEKMIAVNLKGVFLVCQAVGRSMIKSRYGKIINIASMSGSIVNHPQYQSHYNTSKAGVIMLTKSLASEWARYNINVNSVSPGYTLTPLVENLLKAKPEYAELWKNLIPMGRLAEPKDIVGAVIFLASEASNYVTGHDLIVDGGYTIW